MEGKAYRRCLSSGEWSGEQPKCKKRKLHEQHAKNVSASWFYLTDMELTFINSLLYLHQLGALYYTPLQHDQQYYLFLLYTFNLTTSADFTMTGTGCERLISPRYGVVIHSSLEVGSYAKYFCNEGYYLVGVKFRKCEEEGWTDKAPVCKRMCNHYY